MKKILAIVFGLCAVLLAAEPFYAVQYFAVGGMEPFGPCYTPHNRPIHQL